jgi:hypothetical protein
MGLSYDLNQPWKTLDDWQKEYIETPPEQDCFLLCGRQVGKTTAMSIKAVELCIKHFKKGEFVLINSIIERQAFLMLTKSLVYAQAKYPQLIMKGKDKPTMHKLCFTNGTGIVSYAAGLEGSSSRGPTIKKVMVDEGSRMSELYFVAVLPTMSVSYGSMDIASSPFGKKHPDGTEKFFYKCSKDEHFKKFYVSAEDCPRHTKEFLERQKNRLTKLAYAQEYLAVFTDELQRIFPDELLNKVCVLKRIPMHKGKFYLGVDVAGFGEDECSFEIMEKMPDKTIEQRESITERHNYTTDTTRRILELNSNYKFKKIGVDDGGLGFGVFSELMNNKKTKGKTEALNNSSRFIDEEEEKSVKLLKEAMYVNLLVLMENNKIKLLDDDEIKASLSSIQHDEGKIFSFNAHITEGISRAVWVAEKDKSLNIWCR